MTALALRVERQHQPPYGMLQAPPHMPPHLGRDTCQNRLLQLLPDEIRARLAPHLELVTLPLGTVLCEPASTIKNVYFPVDAIISMVHVMENGASAQTAMIGTDGLVGVSLLMSGSTPPCRTVVHSAGQAFKLRAGILAGEFDQAGALTQLLLRYTQSLITQMAQTAVCNRHHSLEQQLCRWLLMSHDRLPGNDLQMTQELISNLLGVRREGVTEAAGKLQRMGMIRYSRGRITVTDRSQLEDHACECYGVVKRETDRLLSARWM